LFEYDLGLNRESLKSAIEAVKLEQWLYGCWQLLEHLSNRHGLSSTLDLPLQPLHCFIESHRLQATKTIDWTQFASLEGTTFLKLCKANYHYNRTEYHEAERILSSLEESLEAAELLSDILFQRAAKTELYSLVQHCTHRSQLHPSTAYATGNLYALLGQHEKAALSFRRVVRCDPKHVRARLLLAQQLIELRRPEAALVVYEEACLLAPADYRAWHGMGQLLGLMDHRSGSKFCLGRASILAPPSKKASIIVP